jgi:hypothetical protein
MIFGTDVEDYVTGAKAQNPAKRLCHIQRESLAIETIARDRIGNAREHCEVFDVRA